MTSHLVAATARWSLLVTSLCARVSFAQPAPCRWEWKHPYQTGADLTGVTAVGEHGFVAVGTEGTILRSLDEGASWKLINVGVRDRLAAVAARGSEVCAVGAHGLLLCSTDQGAQWRPVRTGTGRDLEAIWYDDGTLYLTGAGGMILRREEGKPFSKVQSPTTSTLRGGARIGDALWVVGDAGAMLRSQDGRRWSPAPRFTREALHALIGRGRSLLAIGNNVIAVSHDTGRTWQTDSASSFGAGLVSEDGVAHVVGGKYTYRAPLITFFPVRAVPNALKNAPHWPGGFNAIAADPARVMIAVGDSGGIARSEDEGTNWRLVAAVAGEVFGVHLNSLWVDPPDVVLAAGAYGVLLRWAAGTGWRDIKTGSSSELLGIWRTGPAELLLAGRGGTLLRSTDDGLTWNAVEHPGGRALLSAIWGVGDDLFIAGSVVLYSADRGKTWVDRTPAPRERWGLFGVSGRSATDVYLVGVGGALLHSVDHGLSWRSLKSGVSSTLHDIWVDPRGHLAVAVGDGALVVHGETKTWRNVLPRRRSSLALSSVWGNGHGELMAASREGLVYHSADSGVSWQELPTIAAWVDVVRSAPAGAWWLAGLGSAIIHGTCGGSPQTQPGEGALQRPPTNTSSSRPPQL